MNGWDVENWIDETELSGTDYFEYWNDLEKEKEKEWYVLNDDFAKVEEYLDKIGLPNDLKKCVEILKTDYAKTIEGTGIDLAAGTLWAAPHIFNLGKIDKLYCLEFSRHRLLFIGTKMLNHYSIPKNKVTLVYGSFYKLQLDNDSIDFVILSAAFHHAERPHDLLSEVYRVLRTGGICIIIGEHPAYYYKALVKNYIKMILMIVLPRIYRNNFFKDRTYIKALIPSKSELFPTDPIAGDHYYTLREYRSMFIENNFHYKKVCGHKSNQQSFILIKK